MDPFTIVLIIVAALVVVGLAIHELRTWRKPGRRQKGVLDDAAGADALSYSQTAARNADLGANGPGL